MKTCLALACGLALGLLSPAARADLAPPIGSKRIAYQFTPSISGDTTGQVVFSYPCEGSNGAPGRQVTPLVTGRGVAIGSHESCQIFVVAKDAYDAWAKDGGTNAPAQDLIAQAKVCTGASLGGPRTVAVVDPRSSINDAVDVKVGSGSCTLSMHSDSAPAPAASSPEKKGCNASGSSSFPLLLAVPALAVLLKKRRG